MSLNSLRLPVISNDPNLDCAACGPTYLRQPFARARVYCFPFAGASTHIFRNLQSRFGGLLEFVAVELPGHGSRQDAALSDAREIATVLCSSLFPAVDPYFFLAISSGSLVAFELIRLIESQQYPPPLAFFVCSEAAPQQFPACMHKEGFYTGQLEDEYNQVLQSHRWFEELPKDFVNLRSSLYRDLYQLVQADQQMELQYMYEGPIDTPIVAFAEENDGAMVADMQQWEAATQGAFAFQVARSGGHVFPIKEPEGGEDYFMRRLSAIALPLLRGKSLSDLPTGEVNTTVQLLREPQAASFTLSSLRKGFSEVAVVFDLLSERHCWFIRFDATGVFIPNIRILESCSSYSHALEALQEGRMTGDMHLEGYASVNQNLCKCVADISLETRKATAYLLVLEDTSGFELCCSV